MIGVPSAALPRKAILLHRSSDHIRIELKSNFRSNRILINFYYDPNFDSDFRSIHAIRSHVWNSKIRLVIRVEVPKNSRSFLLAIDKEILSYWLKTIIGLSIACGMYS